MKIHEYQKKVAGRKFEVSLKQNLYNNVLYTLINLIKYNDTQLLKILEFQIIFLTC